MKTRILFFFVISLSISINHLFTQTGDFDVNQYKDFLRSNQNLSVDNLLSTYPSGLFLKNFYLNYSTAKNFANLDREYKFTDYEKSLLQQNGFMVTERLSYASFMSALKEIYEKDLPVFISTDAILHAMHMSYDVILLDLETSNLMAKLDTLLTLLHKQLPSLSNIYSSNSSMTQMLQDLDVYLTVPRKLLDQNVIPFFETNNTLVNKMIDLINQEKPENIFLFAKTLRSVDFSQFKPRGHYLLKTYLFPLGFDYLLAKYFKAMMWLGRTEIYLLPPRALFPAPTPEDIQRQTIMAALLLEAMQNCNGFPVYNEINNTIRLLVGEQDNVTLSNLQTLFQTINLQKADQFLDSTVLNKFQISLKQRSFASQKILSQIIMSDISSPDSIIPASAFLLFGQRFVFDSYVTSQVVFDRIKYNNTKITRMLPSTLDVLFSLGNNAAGQLLKPEIDKYHYAQNLAALRYLIESYDLNFWNSSFYNTWLNSIRKLNPPENRSKYPKFMQAAAWWQEKMNTQLASWAELRHDNLLYAKQSYSGYLCSFPTSYVEPIPEFYNAIINFASNSKQYFQNISFNKNLQKMIINYFSNLASTCNLLSTIAQKELDRAPLSFEENQFLKQMLSLGEVCGGEYSGWYPNLFYKESDIDFLRKNYVVADVHTAPTDESGSPVGWVLHAGVGPINMGVFIAETPDSQSVAYIGPVMSYYENVTTNFKRLTDEEWDTIYAKTPSMRPSFVNLYLADGKGESRGYGPSLLTSVKDNMPVDVKTGKFVLEQNYPNPFNPATIIKFSIPHNLTNLKAKLTIYNVQGQIVKNLIDAVLPEGNYLAKWDGTNNNAQPVTSGIYFYRLMVGNNRLSGKMSLIR